MEDLNKVTEDQELDDIFNAGSEDSAEVEASAENPTDEVEETSKAAESLKAVTSDNVDSAPVAEQPSELDALRADYEKLNHKYRSDDGRIAALQRQVSDLKQVNSTLNQSVDAKATTKTGADVDSAQIVDDLYSGDEARAKAAVETIISRGNGDAQDVEATVRRHVQPLQEAENKRTQVIEEQALEQHYPEWRQTVNSPEFKRWFSDRPLSIRNLAESDASQDAVDLLDYYSATTKTRAPAEAEPSKVDQIKAKREKQLASGTGMSTKGGAGATGGEPTDPDALFNYLERNDPDYNNTALRR
jgi:hypothetical protein